MALDGDFDDFFDFAIVNKLKISNLTVVLDNAKLNQRGKNSGTLVIDNWNKSVGDIDGKILIGKDNEFKSNIKETCTKKLVKIINRSRRSILITVGSLRDIAAIVQDDSLKRNKIEKIVVFASDYENTYMEYNVQLDPEAYNYVLHSGIKIYLVPCFEKGLWTTGENSSYFVTTHEKLLKGCSDELLKWFVNEYEKQNQKKINEDFYDENRNIWASSVLPYFMGANYDEAIRKYNKKNKGGKIDKPFTFEKKDDNIYCFKTENYQDYVKFSEWYINYLLKK